MYAPKLSLSPGAIVRIVGENREECSPGGRAQGSEGDGRLK